MAVAQLAETHVVASFWCHCGSEAATVAGIAIAGDCRRMARFSRTRALYSLHSPYGGVSENGVNYSSGVPEIRILLFWVVLGFMKSIPYFWKCPNDAFCIQERSRGHAESMPQLQKRQAP